MVDFELSLPDSFHDVSLSYSEPTGVSLIVHVFVGPLKIYTSCVRLSGHGVSTVVPKANVVDW